MQRVYLDHSATTPAHPAVVEAMLPFLGENFGNAGSVHAFGRRARKALEDARENVAEFLGADPRCLVFCSGGTEANNLAVSGVLGGVGTEIRGRSGPPAVLTSAVEHDSVLRAAERHSPEPGGMLQAPVDADGRVDPVTLETLLSRTPGVVLTSIQHVNSETGVLQPIEEIGAVCRSRGVLFHTDAVQSAGTIPLSVDAMGIDLLSVSGHKIGGPQGIGVCYLRRGIRVKSLLVGGAQERRRRAGTENVAAIVGFGEACRITRRSMASYAAGIDALRRRFEEGLLKAVPDVWINGSGSQRASHITNVGFGGVEGESIFYELDARGVAVSTGSACTSGSLDPSHVLLAMGQSYAKAQSAIRFSLGRSNSAAEMSHVVELVAAIVAQLRSPNHNKVSVPLK